MSPFEHVAQACEDPTSWANFHGWRQFRYFLPNESGRGGEKFLPKFEVEPFLGYRLAETLVVKQT